MGWKRRLELSFRNSFLYRHSVDSESTTSSVERTVKVKKEKKPKPATLGCTDYLIHDWRVRIVYVLLLAAALGLAVPALVSILLSPPDPTSRLGTCTIDSRLRIPLPASNFEDCEKLKGCWNASAPVGASSPRCYHRIPSQHSYKIKRIYNQGLQSSNSKAETDIEATQYVDVRLTPANLKTSPYGTLIQDVRLTAYAKVKDRLTIRVSKVFGKEEIGDRVNLIDSDFQVFTTYSVGQYFRLRVFRRSTKTLLFDHTYGALLVSKEYNEFSTTVPTPYVYGLGGPPSTRLLREFNNTKWTLHNSPRQAGQRGRNGYHPFYLAFEPNGDAHGVLVSSGAPIEVTFLPAPALHFKTIGNDFKIHIFAGPSPKEITKQTSDLIDKNGLYKPPDWVFNGLHLCREIGDPKSFKTVIESLEARDVPVASDCIDKFLFPFGDFQHDSARFPDALNDIQWLKNKNIKFIATYPPQVKTEGSAFENGKNDLFIRDSKLEKLHEGLYHNRTVVYPTFGSDNADKWLNDLISAASLSFNGLFLIDNSPLDGSTKACNYTLQFQPTDVSLSGSTICLGAKHLEYKNEDPNPDHIFRHNRYGFSQLEKTFVELYYRLDCDGCRSNTFLITETGYIGGNYLDYYGSDSSTGYYGSAFLGDFTLDWASLKMALVRLQEYGLYGNPISVMPLCGTLNSEKIKDKMKLEEVCTRWYQIGALSPIPYSVTRAKQNSTSPEIWSITFMKHIRDLFDLRRGMGYTSIVNEAMSNREPIVRPLLYDFPKDKNTWTIDTQFMVGSSIMATPNVEESQPPVINVYFPVGKWVDYYTPEVVIYANETVGGWRSVQTNPYLINLYRKI